MSETIGTAEAARIIGKSTEYVRRLRVDGEIEFSNEGRKVRIDKASLEAYMKREAEKWVGFVTVDRAAEITGIDRSALDSRRLHRRYHAEWCEKKQKYVGPGPLKYKQNGKIVMYEEESVRSYHKHKPDVDRQIKRNQLEFVRPFSVNANPFEPDRH